MLFDLYETLITEVRGDQLPSRVVATVGDLLGISNDAFGERWRALRAARITTRLPLDKALEKICSDFGHQSPDGVVAALAADRQREKDLLFVAIDPGVEAMLQDLRRLGLRVGVISNCSVEEVAAFDTSPLAPLADEAIWSFAVGLAKPDPAIYREACHRLGVEPTQAVFVGDGGSDELRGAATAGLLPLWATWFARRWPPDVYGETRRIVRSLSVDEIAEPADLYGHVRGSTA